MIDRTPTEVDERDPADAIRRVARVMSEEAAALADTRPDLAEWLEKIAVPMTRLANEHDLHGEA